MGIISCNKLFSETVSSRCVEVDSNVTGSQKLDPRRGICGQNKNVMCMLWMFVYVM